MSSQKIKKRLTVSAMLAAMTVTGSGAGTVVMAKPADSRYEGERALPGSGHHAGSQAEAEYWQYE